MCYLFRAAALFPMTILDHPVWLALVLLFLFVGMVEAGFRLAVATGAVTDDARREQITASRDALGVLLSLLLGFTLAMGLPRYDLNRQLVLEEANAIGTSSLRAGMLPSPQRETVRELLLSYTQARLAFSRASMDFGELEQSQASTKQLQSQLWDQAEAVVQSSPTPITSLFIQSLNEMFDISEKRMAALENRIPQSIWLMLALLGVLTCLMFGYAARRRVWVISIVTPLMIAIVMSLIADLDSPRNGSIKTDLRSLQRVERDLQQSPAPAPSPPARRL